MAIPAALTAGEIRRGISGGTPWWSGWAGQANAAAQDGWPSADANGGGRDVTPAGSAEVAEAAASQQRRLSDGRNPSANIFSQIGRVGSELVRLADNAKDHIKSIAHRKCPPELADNAAASLPGDRPGDFDVVAQPVLNQCGSAAAVAANAARRPAGAAELHQRSCSELIGSDINFSFEGADDLGRGRPGQYGGCGSPWSVQSLAAPSCWQEHSDSNSTTDTVGGEVGVAQPAGNRRPGTLRRCGSRAPGQLRRSSSSGQQQQAQPQRQVADVSTAWAIAAPARPITRQASFQPAVRRIASLPPSQQQPCGVWLPPPVRACRDADSYTMPSPREMSYMPAARDDEAAMARAERSESCVRVVDSCGQQPAPGQAAVLPLHQLRANAADVCGKLPPPAYPGPEPAESDVFMPGATRSRRSQHNKRHRRTDEAVQRGGVAAADEDFMVKERKRTVVRRPRSGRGDPAVQRQAARQQSWWRGDGASSGDDDVGYVGACQRNLSGQVGGEDRGMGVNVVEMAPTHDAAQESWYRLACWSKGMECDAAAPYHAKREAVADAPGGLCEEPPAAAASLSRQTAQLLRQQSLGRRAAGARNRLCGAGKLPTKQELDCDVTALVQTRARVQDELPAPAGDASPSLASTARPEAAVQRGSGRSAQRGEAWLPEASTQAALSRAQPPPLTISTSPGDLAASSTKAAGGTDSTTAAGQLSPDFLWVVSEERQPLGQGDSLSALSSPQLQASPPTPPWQAADFSRDGVSVHHHGDALLEESFVQQQGSSLFHEESFERAGMQDSLGLERFQQAVAESGGLLATKPGSRRGSQHTTPSRPGRKVVTRIVRKPAAEQCSDLLRQPKQPARRQRPHVQQPQPFDAPEQEEERQRLDAELYWQAVARDGSQQRGGGKDVPRPFVLGRRDSLETSQSAGLHVNDLTENVCKAGGQQSSAAVADAALRHLRRKSVESGRRLSTANRRSSSTSVGSHVKPRRISRGGHTELRAGLIERSHEAMTVPRQVAVPGGPAVPAGFWQLDADEERARVAHGIQPEFELSGHLAASSSRSDGGELVFREMGGLAPKAGRRSSVKGRGCRRQSWGRQNSDALTTLVRQRPGADRLAEAGETDGTRRRSSVLDSDFGEESAAFQPADDETREEAGEGQRVVQMPPQSSSLQLSFRDEGGNPRDVRFELKPLGMEFAASSELQLRVAVVKVGSVAESLGVAADWVLTAVDGADIIGMSRRDALRLVGRGVDRLRVGQTAGGAQHPPPVAVRRSRIGRTVSRASLKRRVSRKQSSGTGGNIEGIVEDRSVEDPMILVLQGLMRHHRGTDGAAAPLSVLLQEAAEAFAQFDVQQLGELDRSDFKRALRQMGCGLSQKQLDDCALCLDPCGRGVVELDDFVRSLRQRYHAIGPSSPASTSEASPGSVAAPPCQGLLRHAPPAAVAAASAGIATAGIAGATAAKAASMAMPSSPSAGSDSEGMAPPEETDEDSAAAAPSEEETSALASPLLSPGSELIESPGAPSSSFPAETEAEEEDDDEEAEGEESEEDAAEGGGDELVDGDDDADVLEDNEAAENDASGDQEGEEESDAEESEEEDEEKEEE
eukprot:TRINITY_DN21847_c0_g1_i3.p1 TRINITY_DN21847_c0_g1~~TRINITY_DN21847_c0_g1_i3.p1  ORF type:complete len:1591 (-),score=438.08 TRINITY_DN21847_c0_g1_i3:228-5000(-)